jgi:hypothetical protein
MTTSILAHPAVPHATRWMRKPDSYDSIEDALKETARLYRRNLMVARGFSSETFAYEAIAARGDDDRDYYVYYLGDFDRSGHDAAESLQEKLERFAEGCPFEVIFEHIAVTKEQIDRLQLPTRPHKRNSPADKALPYFFGCELDAIIGDDLSAIEAHLPQDQYAILKVAERSEREILRNFIINTGAR